jgi:hypothetical protein
MKPPYTKIQKDSSPSNHNTWICSLCYPFALEIGSVYGNGSLIYMKNHKLDTLAPREYGEGKYAVLSGQGHRDDEIIIFDSKPIVTYESKYKLYDYFPKGIKLAPDEVVEVYEMLQKCLGYDIKKHGSLSFFFIKQLHNLIVRWEKKNGKVEDYYENFVKEREVYLIEKRENEKANDRSN